jgi:DNA phosphorothioation-dependent restriction protein DptG
VWQQHHKIKIKNTPHQISNVYLFIYYLFLVAKFHNWATTENPLQRVQFFFVAKVAIF